MLGQHLAVACVAGPQRGLRHQEALEQHRRFEADTLDRAALNEDLTHRPGPALPGTSGNNPSALGEGAAAARRECRQMPLRNRRG